MACVCYECGCGHYSSRTKVDPDTQERLCEKCGAGGLLMDWDEANDFEKIDGVWYEKESEDDEDVECEAAE